MLIIQVVDQLWRPTSSDFGVDLERCYSPEVAFGGLGILSRLKICLWPLSGVVGTCLVALSSSCVGDIYTHDMMLAT